MIHHRFLIALTALVASTLSGCGSITPNYDTRFGDALRQARLDMTHNPDAGQQASEEESMDGAAAQQAIGRYRSGPAATPTPATGVNITGGTAAGSPGL